MNALSTCLRPSACSSLSSRMLNARPTLRRAVTTGAAAADTEATTTGKAYAKFCIYKGKGAMQLSMIAPRWKTSAGQSYYVEREGVMFAEFANVHAGSGQQVGYGDRSYNWEHKIVFALKPVELGHFLDDKLIKEQGVSLYHDPDKGTQNEGSTKKTFAVKVNPDDSFMFSISQSDKSGTKTSVMVPVTQSEMAVIRNLVQFSVPRLLGFDLALDTLVPSLQ